MMLHSRPRRSEYWKGPTTTCLWCAFYGEDRVIGLPLKTIEHCWLDEGLVNWHGQCDAFRAGVFHGLHSFHDKAAAIALKGTSYHDADVVWWSE